MVTLTALPFAKFGLDHCGQDREKPKGGLFSRFEPQVGLMTLLMAIIPVNWGLKRIRKPSTFS